MPQRLRKSKISLPSDEFFKFADGKGTNMIQNNNGYKIHNIP